jgi:hypothetical protein
MILIETQYYAKKLLQEGIPYRDIQKQLKIKFGSGFSNTTLQKLQLEVDDDEDLRSELERVRNEMFLYKKLYFELLEAMKDKIQSIKD